MTQAFDPSMADIQSIVAAGQNIDRLYISDIFQKTYIDVDDESGTTAAAATAIVGTVGVAFFICSAYDAAPSGPRRPSGGGGDRRPQLRCGSFSRAPDGTNRSAITFPTWR